MGKAAGELLFGVLLHKLAGLWKSPKAQLEVGTTILGIILASDKTHLTNYAGDKSMHAVYMSMGNIHKAIQRKLSNIW